MSELILLPCPFCGGDGFFDTEHSIHCEQCPCEMNWDHYATLEQMASVWNKRK